jgi:hypothetical protein
MSDHRSASGLQDAVAQCMQQLGVGSAQRVGPTIDDFLAFLESCGVDDFGAVTADSCLRFVGSRLQSGRLASLATQHNRRAALRTLFKTALTPGCSPVTPPSILTYHPRVHRRLGRSLTLKSICAETSHGGARRA